MRHIVRAPDDTPASLALKLAASASHARPSAEALEVIVELSLRGPQAGLPIDEVRRRYRLSRRPMLAAFEAVESVFHVRLPVGGAPPLTIIRPRNYRAGAAMPGLLFLHGGGWTVGDLASYEPLCRQLANAMSAIVVFVDYRLAPEHPYPAALEDTQSALRWVRANAHQLGIDRDRIGIAGDSAGGNLAAVAAIGARNESQPLWLQLLIYPALDLLAGLPSHRLFADGYLLTAELYAWYRKNYVGTYANPGHWRLSPLLADEVRDLPPAIILYAGFDPLRDEANAYARRLKDAGVAVETIFFPNMIHGFLGLGGRVATAHVGIERIALAFARLPA